MASGTSYPLAGVYKNPGVVFVGGTFQCNSTSNPDILIGKGWSVARSDVGKFTLTFDEAFPRVMTRFVSIGETANDGDHAVHFDEIADLNATTTAKTMVIYSLTAGSDADIDNTQISFGVFFINSSVNAGQTRSS